MVDLNTQSIGTATSLPKAQPVKPKPVPSGEASFGNWLEKSINAVNKMNNEADTAAGKLASGESKDIHGTMISMQKADIAMNLMMEVRNKIISAYEEVKRMQF